MSLTQLPVYVGVTPDDGTGDSLRAAFLKVNQNTSDLLSFINNGPTLTSANISLLTVGTLTANVGSFTTLTSSSFTVSSINNTPIGNATPSTGSFTVLTTANAQVTGGAITGTPISGSTGGFTALTTANAQVTGGAITGTPISGSTGSFTVLDITSLSLTSGGAIISNETGTTFGTTPVVIDSFAIANYRTAKYVITVTNGTTYQAAEVLVIQDGTNAYTTTYSVLSTTGIAIATFSSSVVGAIINVSATGTATGNVAKVQRMYTAV